MKIMAKNQVRVRTGNLPTDLAVKGAATKGTRAYMAGAKVRQAASYIKAKPGKAGLAMAGLAAAGGLGMAGAKAIGNARKPKSLTDRLKNASKKMFK